MGTVTINVAIELDGDQEDLDLAEAMVEGLPEIFQGIIAERHRQDQRWGGMDHDDSHSPYEWERMLGERIYHLTDCVGEAQPRFRRALEEIASLAVAAIQSFDRLNGNAGV